MRMKTAAMLNARISTAGSPADRAWAFCSVRCSTVCRNRWLGLSIAHSPQVSIAFVFAVAISNIPQGLSGTAGMLSSGWSKARITRLWLAVCGASILAAIIDYAAAQLAPGASGAMFDAFAADAQLVMLADSMIPESFEHGGSETGLAMTLAQFSG
jgi:ZIP family zinc transporter